MLNEDVDLRPADVQAMSGPDGVARLFLTLGYPVDRLPLSPEALSITADELKRQIRRIEQIAIYDDWLHVYLLEMRSIRVADRQALARSLRDVAGEYLLVLTSDYDTLDVVLLDKSPPQGAGPARRQVVVRPRVFTVERKKPGQVALRVLRRFTCTEADPFQQFEKLLSAYTVAEWSEALFNNRALFSDYYLKERLPGLEEWQEDPTAAHRSLRELVVKARPCLSKADDAKTRAALLEPLFAALGFSPRQVKAAAGDSERPDYLLLDAAGGDEPLVTCLAYPWNRYLDGRDDQRDTERPTDNPGARVVSLLQDGSTPYAILTNGKLWRLYAAQTHSRATNYYEIDLEEALQTQDRQCALRYFWLFFRAAAFHSEEVQREGRAVRRCFIDRMVEGSEDYAKALRERLKDRVFEEITPRFAEGFVAHIRQVEGPDAPLNQERLDLIYASTLTFLYRLMFVLYAEALNLLPVQDVRGYWRVSLQRLKEEVAERGGTIDDESPGRLRRAYRADSTELYDRLLELFAVIDGGSLECNVPRYNGGLFVTEPDPTDDDQQARIARFLRECKIPDRHLALGLDRLARDRDDKTHALVSVDFESLGVRQLGSIYEGLLEFKLRIAPARMAAVKGKRTDEIIPYAEAKRKKRAILTTGRGANAVERTLPKGAVYLENDRRERKATGSYYTPDYIVRYIVQHTVGPVLEEKLEALRPRLREAEGAYRRHVKNAEAKSRAGGRFEDPEKFWNREEMLRLAYDVLDIKVLDPAMGSGHFLVEVVDAITDRLLDFLNAFPHNPVAAGLRRTREAILEAMEEQRVSIDRDRLNDVALLKRQVLKRCVYGVDLNPMAVELAKVSLWLDAFTLGAPLSFLDHHLRCGNSLIGAMAREVEATFGDELPLFRGPFAGLLRSAQFMRGIGMLADATMEQAQESAALFREFERAAKPYKQLLDIYVLRDFDVQRADEFLRRYGAEAMRATPEALGSPYRELLAEREAMYRRHRFFHWDLEFPEVFIDLDHSTWKGNPGFDAVVGNPPWVGIQEMGQEPKPYLSKSFRSAQGKYDLYALFIEKGVNLISTGGGMFGMICQSKFLVTDYGRRLRGVLSDSVQVRHLVQICPSDIFEGITTYPLLLFASAATAAQCTGGIPVIVIPASCSRQEVEETLTSRNQSNPFGFSVLASTICTQDPWVLEPTEATELSLRVRARADDLAEHVTDIAYGVKTNLDPAYLRSTRSAWLEEGVEASLIRRAYKPRDMARYELLDTASWMLFPYEETPDGLTPIDLSRFKGAKAYFDGWRERLSKRRFFGMTTVERGQRFYELPYTSSYSRQPKLVFPTVTGRAAFAYDEGENLFIAPCYVAYPTGNYSPFYLLAVLNSRLIDYQLKRRSTDLASGYYEMQRQYVEKLPVRQIGFSTSPPERDLLLQDLVRRCDDPEAVDDLLDSVAFHLAPDRERSDVVHDLVVHLAQWMVNLNRQKQAETRRFGSWLEGQLGTSIDDLSGKTIIANYLGDYQKGEGELPWDEFLDRLQRNRSKIRANVSDPAVVHRLRQEYEASLATLLPIKQRLKDTDWLIDQIVYKLYGLTEEEIAIVEGRS